MSQKKTTNVSNLEKNKQKKNAQSLKQKAFATLQTKAASYITDPEVLSQIEKAYHFADKAHGEQIRSSGEPYITHPLAVASILTDFCVDGSSLSAAVLHDVVEDTQTPLSQIEKEFGEDIARLVDGLTKLGKIKFRSKQERMAENFRKMILAMAKDLRVILIKFSDRLHNMRTLDALERPKRLRIAKETLEIYAPLAGRLGIYNIKSELEDLCLKQSHYEIYKNISRKIVSKKHERHRYIDEVLEILEEELKKYGFKNVRVYGRPKHFFSIYRKMMDRQLAFDEIHDLFAVRIIVENIKDCYEALGVVHAMWKPMPGRFKDYIAMPKANLYQSLHTTVIRPNGTTAEIQIRTKEMHSVCEMGVAAHWTYKDKNNLSAKKADLEKFSWLRQMMELHHDVKDPDEFLNTVKLDLFEEEIFVFTPQGDVIRLNSGATALDFAFAVHSDIGLTTVGAKINGKITPLRRKVQSGDILEIITSNNQKPSKDWLNFVVTSKARNKIRSHLRAEQRQTSRKIGKELLDLELSKQNFELDEILEKDKGQKLVKAAKENNFEDLLMGIGYGKINAKELIRKSYPPKEVPSPSENRKSKTTQPPSKEKSRLQLKTHPGVLVSGLNNILVTFSRCCNPLPGDEITGFITRGRGVSVHRQDCVKAYDLDPLRRIDVSWAINEKEQALHKTYLRIVTKDRQGVLAEITAAIARGKANVHKAQVRVDPDLRGVIDFEIALKSLEQLNEIITTIQSIPDVVVVERKNLSSQKKGLRKSNKF